jgi:hypothetical protein
MALIFEMYVYLLFSALIYINHEKGWYAKSHHEWDTCVLYYNSGTPNSDLKINPELGT